MSYLNLKITFICQKYSKRNYSKKRKCFTVFEITRIRQRRVIYGLYSDWVDAKFDKAGIT